MSCYLRHLKHFFGELNLEYDKANRKKVDQAVRLVVGVTEGHCPEVWKEVKAWRTEGKEQLLLDGVKKLLSF